ncbi:hypothetical protein N7474_001713 [Penicillium riverlandense]|uniref:uncharacterized protein n=1 Tax=Penicillium riverlandense TaxID=1903569 RepID=UPI0025494705|nr:uncharacterized protein N7474_001713 [Penicillium riverlandense]KAJ5833402.1 hypothetical protein N7474_001713 [Penicillium riverlandense]
MSNQPPPSYNGTANYAPEWASSYPVMVPPDLTLNSEYTPSSQPPVPHNGYPLDYNLHNVNANARIAPHGASGQFLPPFPFMPPFDASQVPPFPPLPIPPAGFSPFPVPTGSSTPQYALPSQSTENASSQSAGLPGGARATSTHLDSNREEGEVSEREHERPSGSYHPVPSGERTRWGQLSAERRVPDREEGEAFSSDSSRSSGSPYNPPLSVSADPNLVPVIETPSLDTPNTRPASAASLSKSVAQLRVQAQGALLSLAPHNIRYNELVAEGINPKLLRQLYEEVGIKVVPPPSDQTKLKTTQLGPQSNTLPTRPGTAKVKDPAPKPIPAVPTPSSSSTKGPDGQTSMERKHVIARMLAEKAAKAANSSASKTDLPKEATGSSSETRPKSKVEPSRVKNKAQTELARQRIEELKRQMLLKSQQKVQQSGGPETDTGKSTEASQVSVSSGASPSTIQHPLPVRPPLPTKANPAGIPGLFMAESTQDTDREARGQTVAVDSTPLARATQRKRPRASDFDEPVTAPKKHLNQSKGHAGAAERLVIDISDDESLYGDDEGGLMDVDSSQEQDSEPMPTAEALLASLRNIASLPTRTSTSTPQDSSRPSDQESIRKKDLEIQAMHKRIAELEQRKKARLVPGPAGLPQSFDSGASSSAGQSSGAEAEATDTSTAPLPKTTPAADVATISTARPNLIDSFSDSSVKVLASMETEQLDSLRSKILRMQAIESGLPDLDAEILSSESNLSHCRQEADRLLSEITKGKEGRFLLVKELKHLGDEITRLSLADLEQLRRQAEVKEQEIVAKEAIQTSHFQDTIIPDAHALEQDDTAGTPTSPEDVLVDRPAADYAVDSVAESSSSVADSTGSSMDESADEESSSDADAPITEGATPEGVEIVEANTLHHVLPEQPPAPAVDLATEHSAASDTHQSVRCDSLESSEASEGYEPPEPDVKEAPGQTYSPPFSPAPPESVKSTAGSTSSIDMSPADEAVTDAPPVSVSKQASGSQVNTLENEESAADSKQRFSPYISPLRNFKAYRYHPNYAEDVSNGYRSLTYSHDIDPMKYLCPYEASGGVCNDRSCEFQHFRDMTLSDDKILIQMGAAREGNTEEEKETYLAGLKEIINEMRRDKVKDFTTVAAEIAAYRRRFLQDPSRVLPM